jgi:hypothetical protein
MERMFGENRSLDDGEHWLTISDLMAGLMMVFLFIAIALMRSAFIERDKIKDVAVAYREGQVAINKEEVYLRKLSRDIEGSSADTRSTSYQWCED